MTVGVTNAQKDTSGYVSGTGTIGTDTRPIKIVNGVATVVGNNLALDSAVVHISGTETVTGIKRFNQNGNSSITVVNPYISVYERPSEYRYTELNFAGANNLVYMQLRATMFDNGGRAMEVNIRDISGNDHWFTLARRED